MSNIRFANLGELFTAPKFERKERNFEGVGRAVDNFIRAQQEERERLRTQGIEDAQRKQEAEDRYQRFATVAELLNSDNPEVRIAAEHYGQTGDASGFSQVAMNESLRNERKKEREDAADVNYLNLVAELQQLDEDAKKNHATNDKVYLRKRSALIARIQQEFGKLSDATKQAEGGDTSATVQALNEEHEAEKATQSGVIADEDLEGGRFGSLAELSKAYDKAVAEKNDSYKKKLQEAFVTRLGNEGKLRKDNTPERDKMNADEIAMAKKFGMLATASKKEDDYKAKLANAKADYAKLNSPQAKAIFKTSAPQKYGISKADADKLGAK